MLVKNEDIKNFKPEEEELCMTIARGLVFQAQKDPHSTFMMGLRGFANDKKGKKITPTNFKNNNKKKEKKIMLSIL